MNDDTLAARYRAVRGHTQALAGPLSEEDCCVQSMPDASPVKWHLAHTTWFFETFLLERHEPGFRPFHPAFRVLFNSYYNGVGDKHPRPQRGMLTRPGLHEVLAYRRDVDERMGWLLANGNLTAERLALVETGLQHEQQHQELLLTDVKHMLSMSPLYPAYSEAPLAPAARGAEPAWRGFDAALAEIGFGGPGFCFDNEMPRHRQFLEPFALASRLVTNGEYRAFVEDGGYASPALWLSEGWDWVQANRLSMPLYWRRDGSTWQEFTLHGLQPLDAQRPATHLSFFEADAYARWRGARLPTEAEWEYAAHGAGDFGLQGLHPQAQQREQAAGLAELFGASWQWTLSSYSPYPGYRIAEGALGEYNGKFMANQYVLRGSSCATPAGHARISYRNFFPASARWQFTGIRLAKSL
ncbi:MAG TPA: ergothioneine biosynthesis protein EgtB [Noviherbaspirillum sp.]|uniref:ergothioneine biosynthesis protein EgtB n=1 Tax=Noviherbaspirillum sp. TaxID=1926288 RepID=UPI002D756BA6|nr:ergothioneine biosynthesis protein EgtB [Noviherbaspirillum sp.]HYD97251.1 ergothioneine biosynthesis protein EgtB [Noviherbaspirillum sp.]